MSDSPTRRRTSAPRQRALAEDWLAPPPRRGGREADSERRRTRRRRALLRRRVRAVALGATLVAIAAGAYEVPRLAVFGVRHVEITGTSAIPDPVVRRSIDDLIIGRTIYTANLDAIDRRVGDLPFVRSVDVLRHAPDGISITVEEYEPLAFGVAGNGGWLIARDGRVLVRARMDDWRGSIPLVRIVDRRVHPGDSVGGEPTLQLLRAIPPTFPGDFESIDRTSIGFVGTLTDGPPIRFGNAGDFAEKLAVTGRLLEIFGPVRRGNLAYIDVSVPSRPASLSR